MHFTSIAKLANQAKFLLNQNSSTILTGVGVVGTVGTAYFTGRASYRAAGILDHAKVEIARDKNLTYQEPNGDSDVAYDSDQVKLTRFDVVKLTWRYYLPAVGTGIVTVSAIIVAHRIDAKRVVALTVASGISERAFKEYREKVIERLGERQDTKLRDEIAQDRVNKTPGAEVVLAGDGKVLCMEGLTGRYFMSSPEDLNRAANVVNHNLNTQAAMGVSLSEFFDEIGLSPTAYSEQVGWNPDKMLELKISATVASDGRPCLVVDYDPHPIENYWRLYD